MFICEIQVQHWFSGHLFSITADPISDFNIINPVFSSVVGFSSLLSWKSSLIYSFHLCKNFACYHKYSLFRFYASCQKARFLSYFNWFLHICNACVLQFFYFCIILIELFLFCLLALAFYFLNLALHILCHFWVLITDTSFIISLVIHYFLSSFDTNFCCCHFCFS